MRMHHALGTTEARARSAARREPEELRPEDSGVSADPALRRRKYVAVLGLRRNDDESRGAAAQDPPHSTRHPHERRWYFTRPWARNLSVRAQAPNSNVRRLPVAIASSCVDVLWPK